MLGEDVILGGAARGKFETPMPPRFDGNPLLWIGRRKTVGRGEGSSGLRFEVVE